ncbi:MAG TPA: efflux transporter outer membrane subunit [Opitutaceae bacterium]|nr:efflux transporter outer membrane subunit [Opitutaceae bacterium]
MKSSLSLSLSLSLAAAAAAAVGPDYARPEIASPVTWNAATSADTIPRGDWWTLFGDSELDALILRSLDGNQDLQAAAARVEQARAAAGIARSAYFPSAAVGASADRSRTSRTTDVVMPLAETETIRGALDASWELDLFGRVRRLNESARAGAAASAADFESVRLALTAEVAANYFSLRALDREIALVDEGVALRRRALELVTSRRTGGAATDFDVARAESELASTEAESSALANRRAALQNALAVLVGEVAGDFAISNFKSEISEPPAVPAGLPSALLERRPDIAAAEQSLVAVNAQIGVAKAAFFPAISLTGSAGYASGEIDRLFRADSRAWSIGPSVYLPIFQGGRNRANLERSRAAYEEGVARYRQRVLIAFREVQDALTATQLLASQAEALDRAVAAARRSGELAQTRYDAGYVNYFEVIDAQRTLLASERAATQLGAQRLLTSVALVKSLGGGWTNPATVASNIH